MRRLVRCLIEIRPKPRYSVFVTLSSVFGCLVLLQPAQFLFAQNESPQDTMAVISVAASENGLPVLIDGKQVGVTPLNHFAVSPGEHEIAVRRSSSESWLDTDWVEKYQLAAGDSLVVRAQLKRGYLINSKPYGAEVYVDQIYQGATPVVIYVDDDKAVGVELRLSGYQDFFTRIDNRAQRLWSVTLLEDEQHATARQKELNERKSRRAHFRKLALLAGGMSVASGVTAVLLKRRADDFYEDYLITGDARELNALFDRTTQYDKYSSVAFVVFQASFGLSFYWFLRSTAE